LSAQRAYNGQLLQLLHALPSVSIVPFVLVLFCSSLNHELISSSCPMVKNEINIAQNAITITTPQRHCNQNNSSITIK